MAGAARGVTERAFGLGVVSFKQVVEVSGELDGMDAGLPGMEWDGVRGTVVPFGSGEGVSGGGGGGVTQFEWARLGAHLEMRRVFVRLWRPL